MMSVRPPGRSSPPLPLTPRGSPDRERRDRETEEASHRRTVGIVRGDVHAREGVERRPREQNHLETTPPQDPHERGQHCEKRCCMTRHIGCPMPHVFVLNDVQRGVPCGVGLRQGARPLDDERSQKVKRDLHKDDRDHSQPERAAKPCQVLSRQAPIGIPRPPEPRNYEQRSDGRCSGVRVGGNQPGCEPQRAHAP